MATPEMLIAAEARNWPEVRRHIDAGADVNTRHHPMGWTVLGKAVRDGAIEEVRWLLEPARQERLNIDEPDTQGFTPLLLATAAGSYPLVQLLVDRGASLVARHPDNTGCLHLAAASGKPEVVKFLLEHGLDVNAVDNTGLTPLHVAAQWNPKATDANGHYPLGCTSLYSRSGDSPAVVNVLINAKAPIDVADHDAHTPLWHAAMTGTPQCATELIRLGADAGRLDNLARFLMQVPHRSLVTKQVAMIRWYAADTNANKVEEVADDINRRINAIYSEHITRDEIMDAAIKEVIRCLEEIKRDDLVDELVEDYPWVINTGDEDEDGDGDDYDTVMRRYEEQCIEEKDWHGLIECAQYWIGRELEEDFEGCMSSLDDLAEEAATGDPAKEYEDCIDDWSELAELWSLYPGHEEQAQRCTILHAERERESLFFNKLIDLGDEADDVVLRQELAFSEVDYSATKQSLLTKNRIFVDNNGGVHLPPDPALADNAPV